VPYRNGERGVDDEGTVIPAGRGSSHRDVAHRPWGAVRGLGFRRPAGMTGVLVARPEAFLSFRKSL